MSNMNNETEWILSIEKQLNTIRMSESERVTAKAHLARAEYIAELIFRAYRALANFVGLMIVKPGRRITSAIARFANQ